MAVDAILRGLDPEQAAIVQAIGGPVVVTAGAGTGKTRALTHRIAYAVATDQVTASQVLALTFTTKAAGEMRSRLSGLGVSGVQARTFHSAALRQARFFWPRVNDSPLPPVRDKVLPLVAEAAGRCRVAVDTARLRDLAGEISWSKVCNVPADMYVPVAASAGRSVGGVAPEQVAAVITAYEQVKHRAAVIDLDDILLVTLGLMMQQPGVAQQVRAQYQHFVVDEYQDVSPVQHALLKAWLGDSDDLMVVGDPAQSIHAFAGANVAYLLGFGQEFPAARRFELTRNYRSSGVVVSYANALAARSQGRVKAVRLRAAAQAEEPPVTQMGCADAPSEIAALVAWLSDRAKDGVDWASMAVLYRVNAQSVLVEAALAAAGIPYTVRGAERFYERAEVKAALAAWRGLATTRPDDPSSALRDALVGLGWTPEPPDGQGRQRENWESWQALAMMLEALPPGETVAAAMVRVEQQAEEQQAPAAPGVVLATLHASKGLEFEAVAIIGVQEGLLPFALATTPDQLAEENRLLYVGVTRAKRWLYLSWDGSRRRPSRFISAPETLQARQPQAPRQKKRLRTCRVCGKALLAGADIKLGRHADCPSSYSDELLQALKAWRLQRATDDKVPAFVVFSDTTLIAIAEARPATAEALLAVSGVGPAKLERYGEAVLGMVADD